MALKRLRNSLTVNIITPFGVGLVSLSGAAGLGRQARRWRQRAGSADGDRRSRTASVSCRGRANSCCGPTGLAAPGVQRWSGNACGPTQQPGRNASRSITAKLGLPPVGASAWAAFTASSSAETRASAHPVCGGRRPPHLSARRRGLAGNEFRRRRTGLPNARGQAAASVGPVFRMAIQCQASAVPVTSRGGK